jgi:hypothetical protein
MHQKNISASHCSLWSGCGHGDLDGAVLKVQSSF